MKQDAPFAIQIELVEGCTLACEFCGINGIREKSGNFKFMGIETLEALCHRLARAFEEGWNPRLEFAMHGEPSMHPFVFAYIANIRKAVGPKVSMVMFSNGSGFLKDAGRIDQLLDAGINTLGLDAYEHVNIVPKVVEAYQRDGRGAPIYHYPQQREHNLHSGRRVGHRDIVVIQDISKANEGNHSSLNTHCGGGMEPHEVLKARCAKPFRELAIRWDGNVAICCNDFRGVYKVGNINDMSLDDLWNHPRFVAARKRLMQSDRNFNPCDKCNAKSMRVGLLPDKMGRQTMDPYTDEDQRHLEEAIAGDSFTPQVRRLWETVDARPLNLYDRKKVGE
jgi:radical SAM protein with 4Fe4S-binding SPASM domain